MAHSVRAQDRPRLLERAGAEAQGGEAGRRSAKPWPERRKPLGKSRWPAERDPHAARVDHDVLSIVLQSIFEDAAVSLCYNPEIFRHSGHLGEAAGAVRLIEEVGPPG